MSHPGCTAPPGQCRCPPNSIPFPTYPQYYANTLANVPAPSTNTPAHSFPLGPPSGGQSQTAGAFRPYTGVHPNVPVPINPWNPYVLANAPVPAIPQPPPPPGPQLIPPPVVTAPISNDAASKGKKRAKSNQSGKAASKRPRTQAQAVATAGGLPTSIPTTSSVATGVGPIPPAANPDPPHDPPSNPSTAGPRPTSAAATVPAIVNATPSYPPSVFIAGSRRPIPNPSASRKKPTTSGTSATDCWAFLRPLETRDEPAEWPNAEEEVELKKKPQSPFVGCKLCTDEWKVWACKDGMTTLYRKHLSTVHEEEWKRQCQEKGINIHEPRKTSDTSSNQPDEDQCHVTVQESFSLETFLERLGRFIVADDQSINLMENPEFRELLKHVSDGKLSEKDIPHRTKMTEWIFNAYHIEFEKLKKELQEATGRISLTTDLWSDTNLTSFMAVTAHFCVKTEDQRLVQRSRLIAFRHIVGSHSGASLGKALVDVLEEVGILHKLGCITLDNASNCNTLMEQLEDELKSRGIPFNQDENRIRCFPHVVNLAVQDILNSLTMEISPKLAATWDGDDLEALAELTESLGPDELSSDIVLQVRCIIAQLRVSGQRRDEFRQLIIHGNEMDLWKDVPAAWRSWWLAMDHGARSTSTKIVLPAVQLLRDCPTRWSSTYQMIDRFLELAPAILRFLGYHARDYGSKFSITDDDLGRLINIHHILSFPHGAQQTLSFEKTPTLSFALPIYNQLIDHWKELQQNIPEMALPIQAGINKIQQYIAKSRKSNAFALSMIINPTLKLDWLKNNWSEEDYAGAEKMLRETMLRFRYQMRQRQSMRTAQAAAIPTFSPTRPGNNPARNQGRGLLYFRNLSTARRTIPALQLTSSDSSKTPVGPVPSASASTPFNIRVSNAVRQSEAELEAMELANDRLVVEAEIIEYTKAGLISSDDLESFDLLRYWEINELRFPILYRVALDVLPIQASAVACERTFSSSKETCTLRRNRLSRPLMEALQMLKYLYRQERLDFTNTLIDDSTRLSIDAKPKIPSHKEVGVLLSQNALDRLVELTAD